MATVLADLGGLDAAATVAVTVPHHPLDAAGVFGGFDSVGRRCTVTPRRPPWPPSAPRWNCLAVLDVALDAVHAVQARQRRFDESGVAR
ncbi:MAG: hypothetical protein R2749_27995 [Acidimicrobiales bacterium]